MREASAFFDFAQGKRGISLVPQFRLSSGKALDDLPRQRHKLTESLRARTGADYSKTIQQMEDEIVVIEAGLGAAGQDRRDDSDLVADYRCFTSFSLHM